mgnify:CR=1 FL=1
MPEQLVTTLPRSYHLLSRLANSVPGVLPHMRTQNEINWRNAWNATPNHTTGLFGDFSFDGMQRPYSSILGGLAQGADMSENVQAALSPVAKLIAAISERPTAQNWMNRAAEQDRTFNTFAPSATPVSPVPYRAEGSKAGNPIEPVFLPGQGRMLKRSSVVATVLQSLRVKQADANSANVRQLLNDWFQYAKNDQGSVGQAAQRLMNHQSRSVPDHIQSAFLPSVVQNGALGALLGGGLGAGTAYLSSDKKGKPAYLKHVLLGALMGGGLGTSFGAADSIRQGYNNSDLGTLLGGVGVTESLPATVSAALEVPTRALTGELDSGLRNATFQHMAEAVIPAWQRHVRLMNAPPELQRRIRDLSPETLAGAMSHRP